MENSPSIIPTGTQVVLRHAKRVPGTDEVRPAGSVAEVVESPTAICFAIKEPTSW
jgi:hypothetical protein